MQKGRDTITLKKGECRAGRTLAPGGVLPKGWFTQISGRPMVACCPFVAATLCMLLQDPSRGAVCIQRGIQASNTSSRSPPTGLTWIFKPWQGGPGEPMQFFGHRHSPCERRSTGLWNPKSALKLLTLYRCPADHGLQSLPKSEVIAVLLRKDIRASSFS